MGMGYQVDNAVILAAGTSSRFAPLSYEMPKALIEVKGEVLIERQIRQLQETGIDEIIIVTGYRKKQLAYLRDKFPGIVLVENPDYLKGTIMPAFMLQGIICGTRTSVLLTIIFPKILLRKRWKKLIMPRYMQMGRPGNGAWRKMWTDI